MGSETEKPRLRYFAWRNHVLLGRALIVIVERDEWFTPPLRIGQAVARRELRPTLHYHRVLPTKVVMPTRGVCDVTVNRYVFKLGIPGPSERLVDGTMSLPSQLMLDVSESEANILCRWLPPPSSSTMQRTLDAHFDAEPA